MKKVQLSELEYDDTKVGVGSRSKVYSLSNGKLLKLYEDSYLENERLFGVNTEEKILDSQKREMPIEIIRPEAAIYDGRKFVGEIITAANGVSFANWEKQLDYKECRNLEMYANLFNRLESIVKSTPDIVYPDICNYDNIFVSDNGRKVELIDYEGLQVGNYPTLSFSSALGDVSQYNNSTKYCRGLAPCSLARLYTKELDIRSLIYFYFRVVFDVDLNIVAQNVSYLDVMLDLIERQTNLNDPDIMHKIWKLFQEKEENEYLGDDVFRIAEKYNLDIYQSGVRRLIRK